MYRRFPKEFDFYPKTWVFPQDIRNFEIFVKDKREQMQQLAIMNK